MKKLLYILLFVPLALYGQENNPCYSVNDYNLLLEPNNLITKDFSAGWNMFGYPCFESIDVIEAFSSIVDKIIIVKDNNGAAYLTEWNFNGIGLLQGGDGYQIKMSDTEYGFSFCDGINLPNIDGCTDCEAANFNKFAITDDGSCSYESELIYGCIYLWADNYDPTATENDESCYRFGCLETWADNFDPLATINSGDCNKLGCTSEWADNYDSFATINDNSCVLSACNLEWADNYDYNATSDDGSCYKYGCSDSLADNFDDQVTINNGSCEFSLIGHSIYIFIEEEGSPFFEEYQMSFIDTNLILMTELWNNSYNDIMYNSSSLEIIEVNNLFNPWSIYALYNSATNPDLWNFYLNDDYVSGYLTIEGDTTPFSIEEIIFGCTDPIAINFNPDANTNSGDCISIEYGCTDESACNYSLTANNDNGSCLFPGELEFFEELYINFSQGTDLFSQGTSLFLQGSSLFTQGTNLFINTSTSIIESIINEIYNLFEIFDSEMFDCDGCLNDLNNNEICDELEIFGCIDINACNFDVNANTDNGSCTYPEEGYGCDGNCINDADLDGICDELDDDNCSDLFISEYVEGWGNNHAIEIYNPTNESIDLSNYALSRWSNGSSIPLTTVLSGTISANDAFVVGLDKRDPNGQGYETPLWNGWYVYTDSISGLLDSVYTPEDDLMGRVDLFINPNFEDGTMYFNGNDAVTLETSSGDIIDVIGKIGEDPGEAWGDENDAYWTKDQTLIRKASVTGGFVYDPTQAYYFDPTLEWDSLPVNTFINLGIHYCDCPNLGCMDETACNYNPEANMADGSCDYAELGNDCEGNITEYIIGMEAEGGIVFYVDETGQHGLVAAMEDLGEMNWYDALGSSESLTSLGYSDWYLPDLPQLELMYSTIGNGPSQENIGGFEYNIYWSSTPSNNLYAYVVYFYNGQTSSIFMNNNTLWVRPIRSF